jgi:hypothetical protein
MHMTSIYEQVLTLDVPSLGGKEKYHHGRNFIRDCHSFVERNLGNHTFLVFPLDRESPRVRVDTVESSLQQE